MQINRSFRLLGKHVASLVLALCLLLTVASCSDTDYLNAIPADSQLLISINPAKVSGAGSPVVLKSLLRVTKVDESGLDLSENIFFFEDAQNNFGLCAKVKDADKLRDVLTGAKIPVEKRRDLQFAALPSDWVIGFSDKAALLMGPVLATDRDRMFQLMARYLNADEDGGITSAPIYAKLDSIDAPMVLVGQANALPSQFATVLTLGAPRDADPSQVMVAAAMEVKQGRLMMKGETFSFNKGVDRELKAARSAFRPITQRYVATMGKEDVVGLFMNVDGNVFHELIRRNRGISAMLTGINAALDMDNILKSISGDLAIVTPSLGQDNFRLRMAARLGNAEWLKDVPYWKTSVPAGGKIGYWGKNCCYYSGDGTLYYFGVTPDLQYMSGGSRAEALASIKPSADPIGADLQRLIVGKRLAMVVNFSALGKDVGAAATALLQPLFGRVVSIVYTVE